MAHRIASFRKDDRGADDGSNRSSSPKRTDMCDDTNSKTAFSSPLAHQFFACTILFGALLSLVFAAAEGVWMYKEKTLALQKEFDAISKAYPEQLATAVWRLNSGQTQELLDRIVRGTRVEEARFTDGKLHLSAGEAPSSPKIERSSDINYDYNGDIRRLGVLTISASTRPIYTELRKLIMQHLISNFFKSFLVICFSFIVFHALVNRHLKHMADRIRSGFFRDNSEPITFDRHRYLYTQADELDELAGSLNNARSDLNTNSRNLEHAHLKQQEDACRHAHSLDAIRETLAALRQYVFVHDPNGGAILSNPPSRGAGSHPIVELLSVPYRDPAKLRDDAVRLGLKCSYASQDLEPASSGEYRYYLELEDAAGTHWRVDGIVFADGTVGMLSGDISRLKEVEAALNQTLRLEAVGTLTGGIAHDFNNILGVILGHIDLAHRRARDSRLEHHLQSARSASLNAARLIRGLLSFARKSKLQTTVIDLNEVVRETISWTQSTLQGSINISTRLQDGAWPIRADKSLTESSLLNLFLNARDAMSEGGLLTVKTANIVLNETSHGFLGDELAAGRYVMLTVSDTGTGIPQEALGKIFDPFYTTKQLGRGNGLGLSMVHGFMKQIGGAITVQSVEGKGTTCIAIFPIGQPALQPGANDILPSISPTVGARLLVLEDERELLDTLIVQLTTVGYEVIPTCSSDDALEIFRADDRIDVILSDVVVPGGMNGVEFVRKARDHRPNIGVVMMTGYGEHLLNDASSTGVGELHLPKPVEMKLLVNAIENALHRSRVFLTQIEA